ncbi:MAG: hypothetical protein HONBIEJF_00492 [Fimbriimonadaceae bacterium]|nr:hypothetical protein [Fimbriimonadaceae bacterium]
MGCGDADIGTIETPPPAPIRKVDVPELDDPTPVRLVRGNDQIAVGDPVEKAFRIFAPPPGSYASAQLPPGFNTGFKARGWSTAKESFATLSAGGRVVLALWQRENVDGDEIREAMLAHEAVMTGVSSKFVPGNDVQYTFWDSGNQRTMISVSPNAKKQVGLVIAVGDIRVMNPLRMSPTDAEADVRTAERELRRLQASSGTGQ